MAPPILILRGIHLTFGGTPLLEGAELSVSEGDRLCLVGRNGSGKSTLLRILAGLLPPEAGDARLGGLSLTEDRDGFMEQVVYAGHLDAVKPQLAVAENLAIWAALYGTPDPQARALAALERLGLARIADFPAAYCSAGQKRRLGLARLLVIDRPLWLLDEPTVSLDVAAVETFAGLVRAHVAAGGLAIAATHLPLDLGPGPEIAMDAPGATTATLPEDDPFLQGAWT